MKYKWTVAEKPNGKYASFYRRPWPTCEYENGDYAGCVTCADEYVPSRVKIGDHAPIFVYVADYSIISTEDPCKWARRKMTKSFRTLKEAYAAFALLLKTHPEISPKW
jgi:hypothetical protein